jgi:hypothetical protein
VSIRGLDTHADQAPAGWPDHHQTLWRLPWEDGLEEYMEWRDWREPPLKLRKTQVVSTGTSAGGVPGGTWTLGGSPPSPPPKEDPRASQLPDVCGLGGSLAEPK